MTGACIAGLMPFDTIRAGDPRLHLESEADLVRRSYCSSKCHKRGRRLHIRTFYVRAATWR
jgi:hypothetical protein